MAIKRSELPHSWAIDGWPPTVFPNSVTKARYLIRVHRDELIRAGALCRIGRDLIVLGDGYARWLQKKAARVPDYSIAPNARERSATA
jgi:hypothetical protein